jgi:hypothetical protein
MRLLLLLLLLVLNTLKCFDIVDYKKFYFLGLDCPVTMKYTESPI